MGTAIWFTLVGKGEGGNFGSAVVFGKLQTLYYFSTMGRADAILLCICITLCIAVGAYSHDDVTERTSIEFRGRISLLFRGNSSSEPQSTAESKAAYSRMNLRMRHDDGKIHEGKVRADGSFVLYDVTSGAYMLEIASTDYLFTPIRVDVSKKNKGSIKAKYADASNQILSYPLLIKPDLKLNYFQETPSAWATVYGLVTSPMMIMMAVSLGMVFFMQNMDPEAIKEAQADLTGGGNAAPEKKPQDMMPGLLAGSRVL